jgi:hypothetical protein
LENELKKPIARLSAKKIMIKTIKLSNLKKGDFFKFPGKKKVYKYDGKVRMYDKWGKYKGYGYRYIPTDDVWGGGSDTFTDRIVDINFEY